MTTIILNHKNRITTGKCGSRPVEFSQALWAWVFTDTDPHSAVECVIGQIRLVNKK